MRKYYPLALLFVVLNSCVKDRDFSYNPYQQPSLPNIGTRQLIHYWNFNNSADLETPTFTTDFATWSFTSATGTTGVYDETVDSTLLNARNGDNVGGVLRLRNPAGAFTLNLSTFGYQNILFSFAVKRTTSGSQTNLVSYSVDGVNFTTDSLAPHINLVDTLWSVFSYDFTAIKRVNHNRHFKIKIDFATGNTNPTGNDRFDNITVDADSIPGAINNAPQLLHYWNLNNSDTAETLSLNERGALAFDFLTVSGVTGYTDFIASTATANERNGDTAGMALRVRNPVNSMTLSLPTTGYKNVQLSYEVDRTSSGAQTTTVSYTTDGINYTNTGLTAPVYSPSIDPLYALYIYDFTAITAANNNPNFKVRLMFSSGNDGISGNNRFDNITVDAVHQ